MELPSLWRWVCILSVLCNTDIGGAEEVSNSWETGGPTSSISSLLSSVPELQTFNRAFLKSNVRRSVFQKGDAQTFFVPHNAAFEKVIIDSLLTCVHEFFVANPCSSIDDILDSTSLDQLVLNHVVEGNLNIRSCEDRTRLQFKGDAVAEMRNAGQMVSIGNALIVKQYDATDGTLYIIDRVLGSKDPKTLLSLDVSLNDTAVHGATKLSDADIFSPAQRQEMAEGAQLFNIPGFQRNREHLGSQDGGLLYAPALTFDPATTEGIQSSIPDLKFEYPVLDSVRRPANDEDLAFMTVLELGALIRSKEVTSLELVQLYTERLKRHDDVLKAVITYTTELANEQALAADALLAKGIYLVVGEFAASSLLKHPGPPEIATCSECEDAFVGPLHGIPYGLKDIIAVPNYKTTWGCVSFKNQVSSEEALVYTRLKAAGAVLIAKLVTGSLAYNDIWFGGQTKNPWNIAEGSTGSSAGSAVSTSAGNVPFSLGSETLGSITYPAARTGVTGLRPTFGMVGRSWVMSLSPSLDKIGPFCRCAADCAVILDIVRGRDPNDISSKDIQLKDPFTIDITKLVVGYLADADMEVVNVLASKGVEMVKFDLNYTVNSAQDVANYIMDVEMLTNFDHWQRSGLDNEYEVPWQWPFEVRRARLISAVDYLQAQRVRGILQREVMKSLKEGRIDAFIGNATDWEKVAVGNLVGMPVIVIPTGLKNITDPPPGGTNRRTTITTGIYAAPHHDGQVLALAMAYQSATKHHLARPPVTGVGPHDPIAIELPYQRIPHIP